MDNNELDLENNYLLGSFEEFDTREKKYFVLIIYDISDNRKRNRMVKVLESYGVRVQKSAFEAILRPTKYEKLLKDINGIAAQEDTVRVYKILGKGKVENFGKQFSLEEDDTIIL